MALANFEALCEGFCELAGFGPPSLPPPGHGHRAISARLQDVVVSAVELPQAGDGLAFLVAEFGPLAPAQELRRLVALLDANALLPGPDAPRFSINPRNGEVVMQWPCALADVTAVEVFGRARRMADAALQWRGDPFLGPGLPLVRALQAEAREASGAGDAGAAARFDALQAAIRARAGQPPSPGTPRPRESDFFLRIRGIDVVLSHSAQHRPGTAFVGLLLPGVPLGTELPHLRELLAANFGLVTLVQGACYARHPVTGRLMLQYGLALAGADASACLRQVSQLVDLHLDGDASPSEALPAGDPARLR